MVIANPRPDKRKFPFAQHLLDEKLDIESIANSLQVLHKCRSKLNTLEDYDIYKQTQKRDTVYMMQNDGQQLVQ